MTTARITQLRNTWRDDLLTNVMPFWLKNSLDTEEGGYFTCLDRDGTVLDTAKYHWLQGREVWTFSRLYNDLDAAANEGVTDEVREEWFAAAALGAKFQDKAKRDDGQLFFSTTRGGVGLHFQRKPYTAVFYILANLEFAQAIKTRQAEGRPCGDHKASKHIAAATDMFTRFRQWIDDPTLCGRPAAPPGTKVMSQLGVVMCLAGLSEEFIAKVPEDTAKWMPFVDDAMRRVVKHFDGDRKIFMETVDPVTGIDHSTMDGRFFNPGHSIEVSWFLLHLCKLKPSELHKTMALEALEGALTIGWDTDEYNGGILYMMDILGKPILDTTVTANNKLWWPQCEALYATMLAYAETKDQKWATWLEKVNTYIYTYFCDAGAGNGEWFGYLNRDGSVFNRCKGGNYKGCFHVPRALLYSMKVAESVMEQQGDGGSAAAAEGIVRAAGSLSVSPVAPGLSSGVRPASPQGTSSWGIGHGHGNNYDSAAKDGHQVPSPSTAGLRRDQAAGPWSPKSGAQSWQPAAAAAVAAPPAAASAAPPAAERPKTAQPSWWG